MAGAGASGCAASSLQEPAETGTSKCRDRGQGRSERFPIDSLGKGVSFETGNGGNFSADPGSDAYWTQLLTWLCEAEEFILVDIDIKPGSDPNSINPMSPGRSPPL